MKWVVAGDTFFTHSESLLGRLIRWGERDHGEEASWANHTGVVVESGWIGSDVPDNYRKAAVVEALWETRTGPLRMNGIEVRVFRPVPHYTSGERERFQKEALSYVGARYGWWKLLFQLADKLVFRGKKVLTHLLFIDKRPICSYLAAKVNQAARPIGSVMPGGLNGWPGFGLDPEKAVPDEMLDFCETHPAYWVEVK